MRDPVPPFPFLDILALRVIAHRYSEDQRGGASSADARRAVLRATAASHPDHDAATILRIAEREVFRSKARPFPLPPGRSDHLVAPSDPDLRRRLVTPLLPVVEDEECTAPGQQPRWAELKHSYQGSAAA